MVDKVTDILKDLAQKYEITLLYAVESGSRAWGFESDDSDYGKWFYFNLTLFKIIFYFRKNPYLDIRFIYMYNDHKKYISLKTFKASIEGFSDDRLYDWNG